MPIEGVKNTRKGGLNWVFEIKSFLIKQFPFFLRLYFKRITIKTLKRKNTVCLY